MIIWHMTYDLWHMDNSTWPMTHDTMTYDYMTHETWCIDLTWPDLWQDMIYDTWHLDMTHNISWHDAWPDLDLMTHMLPWHARPWPGTAATQAPLRWSTTHDTWPHDAMTTWPRTHDRSDLWPHDYMTTAEPTKPRYLDYGSHMTATADPHDTWWRGGRCDNQRTMLRHTSYSSRCCPQHVMPIPWPITWHMNMTWREQRPL
jgi:hypothetical protein